MVSRSPLPLSEESGSSRSTSRWDDSVRHDLKVPRCCDLAQPVGELPRPQQKCCAYATPTTGPRRNLSTR